MHDNETLAANPHLEVGLEVLEMVNEWVFFGGGVVIPTAQPIFPRIDVRDPYKRLGVSREASEEEIREAHNYLSNLVPFSLFSLLHLISSISKKSCNSGRFVFKITSG